MAILHMIDSSGREHDYEITSKPQVFGRGEDSDVILGSRSVARHHMKVWEKDGLILVEDLTAGRGIRLSGEPASGTFEIPPGSSMEVGIFTFSVPGGPETDLGDEILEEAPPAPMLHGIRGATKGVEIELQEGDNDVGREPGLYLVIDDPSVSRLHARLSLKDGRCRVVDMRSSNGTFVNGKRINTKELQSGDVVKFGNLEFRFVHGKLDSKGAAALKRRRLILVAAGSLVGVFLIIGLAAKKCGGEPPPKKPRVRAEDRIPIEVRVEQHLKSARLAMERFDWKAADKAVQAALDLHPISTSARNLKKAIEKEKINKEIFDEGSNFYALNKWGEAREFFLKIPKNSGYAKKVKYKITECETRLTEYNFSEAKAYHRAQQYQNAHKHFKEYMAIRPCDRKVYEKWIKKTEQAMRRYKIKYEPFKYNCTQVQEPVAAAEELDPEDVLKTAYPDPKIFRAMYVYFKGKADVAIQAIRKIRHLSGDPAQVAKAKDLESQLMIVDGKYKEGTALLLRGDVKNARTTFDLALKADAEIMPGGIRSHYRADIQSQLTKRLYKMGWEAYNRQHWEDSFKAYMECASVDKDDTDCKRGLNDLEERGEEANGAAIQALNQGRTDRAIFLWNWVKKFTRPESLPYKKAVLQLQEHEK